MDMRPVAHPGQTPQNQPGSQTITLGSGGITNNTADTKTFNDRAIKAAFRGTFGVVDGLPFPLEFSQKSFVP